MRPWFWLAESETLSVGKPKDFWNLGVIANHFCLPAWFTRVGVKLAFLHHNTLQKSCVFLLARFVFSTFASNAHAGTPFVSVFSRRKKSPALMARHRDPWFRSKRSAHGKGSVDAGLRRGFVVVDPPPQLAAGAKCHADAHQGGVSRHRGRAGMEGHIGAPISFPWGDDHGVGKGDG